MLVRVQAGEAQKTGTFSQRVREGAAKFAEVAVFA